jgi:chitodextrinase
MRGINTITATHGTMYRGAQNTSLWLDELTYSNTPITDVDTTPPAVPAGLTATPGASQVALTWSANSESDLLGYLVYRNGIRLFMLPIAETTFVDSVLADGTYSYQVRAVDARGNSSALSAAVLATVATTPPASGTLVDAGFENGADGATLASPPWTVIGAPQHREYDTARAKNGSQSGWIQGPPTAAYGGVSEIRTAGMTADGSEMRFWAYFDTTNQTRDILDTPVLAADRAFTLQFDSLGNINVRTDRTVQGYVTGLYTPVGTYAVGWTQFRLVYDFATQTYTLSKRASTSDAWTQLKAAGAAGYAIPMRGVNTITSTHGTMWRGYEGANMWLDDLAYVDSGN